MTASIRRSLCLLLVATGVASFASATAADDATGIDATIAMRASFVERASALQQVVPHDLRTRVLLSLPPYTTDADHQRLREDDRDLAVLVELARGSTDPIVLSRLASRCAGAGKVCDALKMAQRWVDADTQNQAAWLALGHVQWTRKDEAAAKATFVRAANASLWRDDAFETGRYLLGLLPKDLSAADRASALLTITGIQPLTPNAFAFVGAECRDAALVAACHRVLAAIFDGARSAFPIALVARLSARDGVDAAVVADRYRTYDAMMVGLRVGRASHLGEDGAIADYGAFNRHVEARLERGERAQAHADVLTAGLTDEQAATEGRQERLVRETRIAEALRGPPSIR